MSIQEEALCLTQEMDPPTNDHVCSHCRNLPLWLFAPLPMKPYRDGLLLKNPSTTRYHHNPSQRSLEESARSDCELCNLIMVSLDQGSRGTSFSGMSESIDLEGYYPEEHERRWPKSPETLRICYKDIQGYLNYCFKPFKGQFLSSRHRNSYL